MENSQILAARKRCQKLGLNDKSRTILMCMDSKVAKCAGAKQMAESWKFLKRRLKELKIRDAVAIARLKTQCLSVCVGGPIAVVMPDGIWYGRCTPDILERILKEHILGGKPVQEYVISESAR